MIKTQEDFFNKIFTSHFIAKVRKGLLKVCVWEGAGDRTETSIFWPSLLWPSRCVFVVLLMLNQRSRGPLCWVMASFTASYQQLLWSPNSIGVPEGPLRPGVIFTYHISSVSVSNSTGTPTVCNSTGPWLPSWLRYIIIQRPHDRPLDLWNRMFNRHQAEITVMQFIGHSLPVHQSMSVPWEFFSSSYFISQFPPTRFPLITTTRMCHLLPVHHLGMAFLAGSKGQNITLLHIAQSSSITGTSLLDGLVLYPEHLLREQFYPLQRCSQCILQPQPTRQTFQSEFKLLTVFLVLTTVIILIIMIINIEIKFQSKEFTNLNPGKKNFFLKITGKKKKNCLLHKSFIWIKNISLHKKKINKLTDHHRLIMTFFSIQNCDFFWWFFLLVTTDLPWKSSFASSSRNNMGLTFCCST